MLRHAGFANVQKQYCTSQRAKTPTSVELVGVFSTHYVHPRQAVSRPDQVI